MIQNIRENTTFRDMIQRQYNTDPADLIRILWLVAGLLCTPSIQAATDMDAQEGFAQARAKQHEPGVDHSGHDMPAHRNNGFHGVFYGYLPCNDCIGIKHTLSLKHNNNYLLITQVVKEASREFYEKGKYTWDDEAKRVTLIPNKEDTIPRLYRIRDEGTLIQLDASGNTITREADRYILQRSDLAQTREVHMH